MLNNETVLVWDELAYGLSLIEGNRKIVRGSYYRHTKMELTIKVFMNEMY